MSEAILSGLNPHQKSAVNVLSGPLLILAGAGSGKTKSLTHRIANLIANGVSPDEILAVTFTNKAANEMKARIEKLLRSTMEQQKFYHWPMPTVGTFHSICVRILREHIGKLNQGFNSNFVIFDTSDSENLIKTIIEEKTGGDKEYKPRPILNGISGAKNQLFTPERYASEMEDNRFTRMIKFFFPLYQKRLLDHNALDFDDLLQKTVELFETCPEVLQKYRNRWKHVCVDEYQDTNLAQYRLVRLLVEEHQNLCVIGDDHQSIYSFRGADFRNILNFEKDFPQAKVIKLEQNYRSTSHILKNANTLISKNKTGHKKNLWTENEKGELLQVQEVYDERDEGNKIAEKIQELRQTKGHSYNDFAVLYRMNAQSRSIEEAFMRAQIPYKIVGGTRFFDRKEIKDVMAYLRLIFNPRDDLAFLRVINIPKRKLGPSTLEAVKKQAMADSISHLEVLKNAEMLEEVPETKRWALAQFYDLIAKFRTEAQTQPISILLQHLLDEIKLYEFLDDGTPEGESRIQNVKELFSVATKYDSAENSLAAFLEGVSLISDLDNLDPNADAVTLMTIHSSKGLEFPVVFLPGWEHGIFPSNNSQHNEAAIEEERRLGYVAITRARKHCAIFHARQRMLFGQSESFGPSPFLAELEETSVERITLGGKSFRTSAREIDENFNFNTFAPKTKNEAIFGISENESAYAIGDRIAHAEWGEGTVVMISGDVLSVAFAQKGIKKIVASVAPIKKV